MTSEQTIDFLREKFNAARERCSISVNDKPMVGLPTITDALNLMDPFVVKAWDNSFAAKTPIWSPLFPYWWWEGDTI